MGNHVSIRGLVSWNRLAMAVALAAGLAAPPACAQSDAPPREFVRAWQEAVGGSGDSQRQATAVLAGTPAWEPYFRSAYNGLTDQKARDQLRPAVAQCQADLLAWNLDRAKEWGKDLRLDYLVALAATTDDPKAAARIGQLVLTAQTAIFDQTREEGPWPWKTGKNPMPKSRTPLGRRDYAEFARPATFARVSGDHVSVRDDHKPALVHARTVEVGVKVPTRWMCLSDRGLRQSGYVSWLGAVVLTNGNVFVHDLTDSLLVCDGDLELGHLEHLVGDCSFSVVIANGDLTMAEGFSSQHSVVYAAGDVYGSKRVWRGAGMTLAGGKLHILPDPADPDAKTFQKLLERNFKEGVKENPFGVKFVSPSDAGVELDIGIKVLRLGKLTDTSPLTKAGLEKGDRVLTLNGVKIETAADFRRQLRESLLWGSGLFEVKRGDQTFLRLVKFAEPPKK